MLTRRDAVLATLAAGVASGVRGQAPDLREPSDVIELWPYGPPSSGATLPTEVVDDRSAKSGFRDRAITGVVKPRMLVFRPKAPNGTGVLVFPGGGYVRLALDKEGYELGRWLSARGATVFVLLYRLPGEGWRDRADVPLQDAQRAMRTIRSRAGAFGVRPDRVAAMGFSAGGHLCGDLATRFDAGVYAPVDAADRLSARPDVAALMYAVQSMTRPVAHGASRTALLGPDPGADLERAHSTALNVFARTPPCFLAHAEDDPTVPVENTLQFRAACKAAGVPVETHLFTVGGHGFGLRDAAGKPVAAWPELFHGWARSWGLF